MLDDISAIEELELRRMYGKRQESRPHTAPAFKRINYNGGKCCCEDYYNCHDCRDDRQFNKDHDAAISRKAREDVLKELIQRLDENVGSMEDAVVEMKNLRNINHTLNKIESFRECISIVESLRQHSTQAGEP